MLFRIVSWNMNHWQRRTQARTSWEYLDMLQPDVALLQECVPPQGRHALYKKGGIGPNRKWGSAIVSYGAELEEITSVKTKHSPSEVELIRTHPGCFVIGSVRPKKGAPLTVISVYGLIDHGYAVTTLHRILSDITPLMDSPLGKRVVLAGDLNCSTQLSPPDRERHRNLFQRIAGLGFIDLLVETSDKRERMQNCPCDDAECKHVQTHRHPRSRVPWQDDYVFATKPLAKLLSSAYAISEGQPDPWELSDHCPLVAEFQL